MQWLCERKIAPLTQKSQTNYLIYYTHFEITGGPCNLTSSNWCDLFTNRTIFALNRIFSPANEEADFKACLKKPIKLQEKWKTKSIMWQILQLLSPKLLFFPQKLMNLISNRLSTASIKYLNWPSPVFKLFQNGCNKVAIEPRVVQFWSEIILVISNHAYGFSPNCNLLNSITIVNYPELTLRCFNHQCKEWNVWHDTQACVYCIKKGKIVYLKSEKISLCDCTNNDFI